MKLTHCICSRIFNTIQSHSNLNLAKQEISKECTINDQCTGTENANTCFTYGKGEGEEGVCTCNDQFDWIDGKCLKGMMEWFNQYYF